MEFFEKIKSTLRRRNLKRAFIFIAIAVGLIAVVFSNGFSTEEIWVRRIGYVPEWLLSSFFLLLALILACLSISSFKDFVKNKEYNALLASVKKIGDINSIGSVLSNLNKSPYTEKGDDLRYNDQLLFYMEDTNVAIIRVNDIVDIRYEKLEPNKESKKYQVCLTYYDGVLKIKTAEKTFWLFMMI